MSQHDLGKCVSHALEQYFRDLDGEKPAAIYDMVLRSVEKPMLEIVLARYSATHGVHTGRCDQVTECSEQIERH